MDTTNKFEQWVLLEIMGHNRFAGLSSVYSITPISEKAARGLAENLRQEPIQKWELPEEYQAKLTFNEQLDDEEEVNEFV